ncbi:GDSL lipase/acylhydrolase family protein [Choiromyces venosus 120613-1]|uniref:GDSL lipase/acylhydrolase family protein n=1 Tax=Choiromyces venosus 120613-1 TaxID=1336337 RepID=A0A3N4JQR4_9PEZI|nr:GDSL lipase/acylhydrolase family protein [Choiromyces venosus 120613-1]
MAPIIRFLTVLAFAASSAVNGYSLEVRGSDSREAASWTGKIENLVVFGDSFTDENRFVYFINHNGSAPPPGTILPESASTATGGRSWARFVSQYTGINLYNYAVIGAVCSNSLTPRTLSSDLGLLFPAVKDYELPAFYADVATPSFPKLSPSDTLYAIWIGTNDLGGDCIITGLPNVGLTNFTQCVIDVAKDLYDHGARNFMILNLAPIERAPLYAPLGEGGREGPRRFWRGKGANATGISRRMRDLVQGGNEIFKYKIPAELGVLKGAKVGVMDTYGLMSDIWHNPAQYLNGSLPYNTTGANVDCDINGVCTNYRLQDRDSFLWYDELHPSEQVSRVIAREVSNAVQKKTSKWIKYW